MPVVDVWARPDRLRRFAVTAGAMADGLAWRRGELDDAIGEYRGATEPAYEADCDGLVGAVEAIGLALRALGEWVGRVGDAFELGFPFGGARLMSVDDLAAALPPELRLDGERDPDDRDADGRATEGADLGALGLTLATLAASTTGRREVGQMATILEGSRGGRRLDAVARSSAAVGVRRLLEVVGLVQVGLAEGGQRWDSEPHRPTAERAGRAALDGGLAVAGTAAGTRVGGGLATAACGPALGPAAVACFPVGAGPGAGVGRRAAELLSDRVLGDEPEPWERDPELLAEEIGDADPEALDDVRAVLDGVAADAAERAERHADFVLDHPWLWDDDHAGAPQHEPPPAGPQQPASGPA